MSSKKCHIFLYTAFNLQVYLLTLLPSESARYTLNVSLVLGFVFTWTSLTAAEEGLYG